MTQIDDCNSGRHKRELPDALSNFLDTSDGRAMTEPDFASNEKELFDEAVEAIQEFARQHSSELFSFFSFDCNPDYGEVLFCLDTFNNSIKKAKEHEKYVTTRRRQKLSYDDRFEVKWAIKTIQNKITGPVLPYNDNPGDFEYQGFGDGVFFPEWENFKLSDDYPGSYEDSEDDYLECNATVMFSRVIDALVENNAFDCLNRTSPFLIGFAFHDGPKLVVRILNW